MEANEVIQTLVRQMNQKNIEIERVSCRLIKFM